MSHERSETHNPHDAAARLHDAVDERTAALRKSAKRWRKAGRREMRRLRREVEAGAEHLGDQARARRDVGRGAGNPGARPLIRWKAAAARRRHDDGVRGAVFQGLPP